MSFSDLSPLESAPGPQIRAVHDEFHGDLLEVSMGPHHPSTHGVLRFIVHTDGEILRKAIPDVGYLHRSIEKIGERCTVGNMTVVLYGTEMKSGSAVSALSVLMKGEVLPAFSHWGGIPTRPLQPAAPRARLNTTAAKMVEPSKPRQPAALTQEELIEKRIAQIISGSKAAPARHLPSRAPARLSA